MARCRAGDKPISEPIMVYLLTYICVTQPQWVKQGKYVTWPQTAEQTGLLFIDRGIAIFSFMKICFITIVLTRYCIHSERISVMGLPMPVPSRLMSFLLVLLNYPKCLSHYITGRLCYCWIICNKPMDTYFTYNQAPLKRDIPDITRYWIYRTVMKG